MGLPAEEQADFWPESLQNTKQRKASNDAAYSPKCSINGTASRVPSCFSSSPSCPPSGGQLSLPFNLIYIDRGLSLAPNGKWARFDYCVGGDVVDLLDSLVEGLLSQIGKQRLHRKKYLAAMDILLANLLHVYHLKGQLLVSRRRCTRIRRDISNPGKVSDDSIRVCSDYLADIGYIDMVVGKGNDVDHNSSWCIPTPTLVSRYHQTKARVLLHPKAELAQLRERPTKSKSKSGIIRKIKGDRIEPTERQRKQLLKLSNPVRAYTATWLSHSATLEGRYLLPWVTRKFIVNTNLGGRFYGAFQNIPSEDRKRILIDGERTLELDFKAIHFSILYAENGLRFLGDPYQAAGFHRDAVKAVCLQLANADNLRGLKACITRSGNPEIQQQYADYQRKRADFNRNQAMGLKAYEPVQPESLEGFIEGIPDGTKGEDLLQAILRTHGAIAHHFGTEDIGLRLQRKDSDIMAVILEKLEGIPVLPVHDSIRCKVSDAGIVEHAMREASIEVTGQPIKIEVK